MAEFVDVIQKIDENRSVSIVYRGHADKIYTMMPSLFRSKGHSRHESEMMRTLFASQPDAFVGDVTTLEKLARFQHFGLPTRLMDVTWNPLVALYFCVKDCLDKDGEVLVIGSDPKKTRFFDSDAVSCLANLCYLTGHERNIIRKGKRLSVEDFNRMPEVKRLVH